MISRAILSTILVLLIENEFIGSDASSWNYQDTDWGQTYPTCDGNMQSPIDLCPKEAKKCGRPEVILKGNAGSAAWPAKNDGTTLKIDVTSARFVMDLGVRDGQNWKLDSYHFHWNVDSTAGSEHLLSGKAFPLEMHLVHYNGKYANLSDAVASGSSKALAVLGIFFEECSTVGPNDLATLMLPANFSNVMQVDGTTIVAPFELDNIITEQANLNKFYRYQGSLTTPTCNEIVTWTVLTKPLPISTAQLADIRSVTLRDGDIRNYRPVQEVNGRDIYLNSGNSLKDSKLLQSIMTTTIITMAISNIYSRI